MEKCSDLLPFGDTATGYDDDLALTLKVNDVSRAVWAAGVIDVTGRAPGHGGVDDGVIVDAEHVHPPILPNSDIAA